MNTSTAPMILLPKHVYEVRILNTRQKTISGYYDDFAQLAIDAEQYDGHVPAIYTTLNPVNPALLARAQNRLIEYAKTTTSDADILTRTYLLIDCDAVRPAGISSTDIEHAAALDRAQTIQGWLTERGWPAPILADSGNGAHLLYKIDLPNDAASTALVKSVLEMLAFRFDDHIVVVDKTVFNAARITKLYGSMACKGDSTPDRPHRRSAILDIPDPMTPVSTALLTALAAQLPREPARHHQTNGQPLDLRAFIARHALTVSKEKPWNGGMVFELETCPFNPEHVRASSLIQFPSGALAFSCLHNSCHGADWQKVRAKLEPDRRLNTGPSPYTAPGENSAVSEAENAIRAYKTDPPHESNFRPIAVPDLLAEPPEEVDWIMDEYLPCEGLVLLVGKPKEGKTTLAYELAVKVALGLPFLGRSTRRSPVLILALEEHAREVRMRLRNLGATELATVYAHVGPLEPTATTMHTIKTFVQEHGVKLIVMDTLSAFWRIENENDAAEMTKVVKPLLQLARESGACLLLIHHARKSEGQYGDEIRGSGALFAAVDVALIMKRHEVQAQRLLQAQSRYPETPSELVIELRDHGYESLGDPAKVGKDTRLAKLIACLSDQPEEADVLAKRAGLSRREGYRLLRLLVKDEMAQQEGKGVKNDPFRFAKNAIRATPQSYRHESNSAKTDSIRARGTGGARIESSQNPEDEVIDAA